MKVGPAHKKNGPQNKILAQNNPNNRKQLVFLSFFVRASGTVLSGTLQQFCVVLHHVFLAGRVNPIKTGLTLFKGLRPHAAGPLYVKGGGLAA